MTTSTVSNPTAQKVFANQAVLLPTLALVGCFPEAALGMDEATSVKNFEHFLTGLAQDVLNLAWGKLPDKENFLFYFRPNGGDVISALYLCAEAFTSLCSEKLRADEQTELGKFLNGVSQAYKAESYYNFTLDQRRLRTEEIVDSRVRTKRISPTGPAMFWSFIVKPQALDLLGLPDRQTAIKTASRLIEKWPWADLQTAFNKAAPKR